MKYRPNSLLSRVVAYFEANPDEELTYADICAKFDANKHTAHLRMKDHLAERRGIEVVTVVRLRKAP